MIWTLEVPYYNGVTSLATTVVKAWMTESEFFFLCSSAIQLLKNITEWETHVAWQHSTKEMEAIVDYLDVLGDKNYLHDSLATTQSSVIRPCPPEMFSTSLFLKMTLQIITPETNRIAELNASASLTEVVE